MKSIFEETVYNEILIRVEALNENSERQWGKMTTGQMAWHCQFPLKWGVENKKKGNGNLFVKLFFKKAMYDDSVWRKSLPTSPALKTIEQKDLPSEKAVLRQRVTDFHNCKSRTTWNPHALFGKLTHEQWGKMQYKHLDHHLKQFGV